MGKPIYSGFRLPGGGVPAGLRGNAVQRENDWLNDDTYLMYMWRLYDLAISVFEWRNLPEGVNERQMEWWLLRNGAFVMLHDEAIAEDPEQRSPSGYAVMQVMLQGMFDIYNIPKRRTAYSVDPEHSNIECDITNSVICFNDNTRTPTFLTLDVYAKMLWQCERTVYTNISQQKTPRIVKCSENQRMSMQNLFARVDGFMPVVWADKDLDLTGVEVLDTVSPYVADKVQIVKHQIWNEALTFLGIENVNTDKKERLVSGETDKNMGDVEAQRFTRLNARKQFCKEANELFGLDLDVEFRSGVYIDAKGGETVDDAMREEDGAETATLWDRFKKMMGGGR